MKVGEWRKGGIETVARTEICHYHLLEHVPPKDFQSVDGWLCEWYRDGEYVNNHFANGVWLNLHTETISEEQALEETNK